MGASRIVDAAVAYQFIKILSTPWDRTDAFKLGIIDADGNILKKSKDLTTFDEKKAYTMVHRLIWNIKRILDKLPPSRTRIGSFAAALWMLKEHTELAYGCSFDVPQDALRRYLHEAHDINITNLLTEERDSGILPAGTYTLMDHVDVSEPGGTITISESITQPDAEFSGKSLFLVQVDQTDQTVMVTRDDLRLQIDESEAAGTTTANMPSPVDTMQGASGGTPKESIFEEDDVFAGNPVFDVDCETYLAFRMGKNRYHRWSRYMGQGNEKNQQIADYCRKNHKTSIILRDESTGAMIYARPDKHIR